MKDYVDLNIDFYKMIDAAKEEAKVKAKEFTGIPDMEGFYAGKIVAYSTIQKWIQEEGKCIFKEAMEAHKEHMVRQRIDELIEASIIP